MRLRSMSRRPNVGATTEVVVILTLFYTEVRFIIEGWHCDYNALRDHARFQ